MAPVIGHHPRKAFPMGLTRSSSSTVWYMSVVMVQFHMFFSGPFLPGYRQDDVKGLPRQWRVCRSPMLQADNRALSSSQTHHLFSSRLLPSVPDTVLMPTNGHIAVNRHLQVGFDDRSSFHLFYVPDSESMSHLASFQLESRNARKIFACS